MWEDALAKKRRSHLRIVSWQEIVTKIIHIRKSLRALDEVYIGRPRRLTDGTWGNPIHSSEPCWFGNPIIKEKTCSECGAIHQKPGDTLPCYKIWLAKELVHNREFRDRVQKLVGKTLVCFCKPKPCHGDILAKAVKYLNVLA